MVYQRSFTIYVTVVTAWFINVVDMTTSLKFDFKYLQKWSSGDSYSVSLLNGMVIFLQLKIYFKGVHFAQNSQSGQSDVCNGISI